ncbi:MAG TPA: alkane 1-monooxygenase [Ferruginibacter sp.]|nr:alkane 1-monooxygenase [Chitinophagales bacterium]HMX80551.1 alkane 1-monooxygenase [Ferruginibacter sp.]HNJ28356.1 alkane 1-monooxygenase [Ferruginibacter sp.]HNJ94443.1 alkane 1-monooxygenase [Ferruginibacter sp.]HNO99756.1 alkane 1-monooxygenase [Ferruginibacter sp.]
MYTRAFKYLSPLTLYVLAWFAFSSQGWLTWSPMLYAWVLLPFIELFLKPDEKNMSAAEEELARHDRTYDLLLYIIVPLQYLALVFFLYSMKSHELAWWEMTGRIFSMGLLCGTFGINVAHELGHRVNPFEQVLAKALLLTSLYMHFFIEHNKGHHKHVATPRDPSSARYNEPLYTFWFRTVFLSYLSAWNIANGEMKKKGLPALHWKNEMLQAQLMQLLFITCIALVFGWMITLYFLAAATIGFLLLETVNYIEHYGLQRKQTAGGTYERAMPEHSWNSNHILGRLMLFELSRHSDHHYLASRKYQVLRHHDDAPQLPTGYPGSMLLALVPPLWFYIMNRKIRKMKTA